MKYEVIYDCDDCRGITEIFEGEWTELKAYIKELRECGYFNIDAVCTDDRVLYE